MNIRVFLKLAGLSLLWGPAFMFMNVAVEEIPPLTLTAARVSLAAIILLLILKWQGRSLPRSRKHWKQFAFIGFTYNALPFFLISWGQQYIDSGLAAILVGTTPLFTMLMAQLFQTKESLDRNKVIGAFIGFSGVFFLFMPGLAVGVQLTFWGMAAALGAAASYGISLVYTRKNLRGLPPLIGPTAQLMMASVYLLPMSFIIEKPYNLPLPSLTAVTALLLLVLLSTVIAFVLYYRLMESTNATTLSLVTYLNPIVATILGVLLLQEPLSWTIYVGCGLILSGAALVNGFFTPKPVSTSTTAPLKA